MTYSHIVSVVALSLVLSACSSGTLPVRVGPQSQHPSPSPLAQQALFYNMAAVPSAGIQLTPAKDDLAEKLFQDFCVGKADAAATEAAMRASGRFGPPRVTEFGGGAAKYVSYPLLERARSSITVTHGAGIQCSVGIDNRGPTLFEDGRITRS